MGQAKIISGGTGGLYNVELVKHTPKSTARLVVVETRIAAINDTEMAAADNLVASASSAKISAEADLNVAMNSGIASDITDKQKVLYTKVAAYASAVHARAVLKAELIALKKEKEYLDGVLTVVQVDDVWCADLTEDLAPGAPVGIIEVNGEGDDEDNEIIIMPGGKTGLGKLSPAGEGSAAGLAYNMAIFPWWQKWKPTYRIGTITAITKSGSSAGSGASVRCNLTLDVSVSSVQGKTTIETISTTPPTLTTKYTPLYINEPRDVNNVTNLTDVFCEYMHCPDKSYAVGDRVIVEFGSQSWANPKVIGFESSPKACGKYLVLRTGDVTGCAAYTAIADKRIADLTREISFINYTKISYYPQVIAYLQSWIGKIVGWMGLRFNPFPIIVTAADMAPKVKIYQDWIDSVLGSNHNLGYQWMFDNRTNAVTMYEYSKQMQTEFASMARVTLTGHKDPAHDIVSSPTTKMLTTSDLIFDFGTFKSKNPYRKDSGGRVTQGAGVNQVNVAASQCYLNDVLTNIGSAVATIVRPVVMNSPSSPPLAYNISSITVNSAGAVTVLKGDDGDTFSTVRDAPGGPPQIPLTSIELAQIWVPNGDATIIEASWIRQMPALSDWSELAKNQDITGFQEGRDRSALIEKLWEYLDNSQNSTVLDFTVDLTAGASVIEEFSCKLRGGMDENSVFYLLATECKMTGMVEPLVGTTYRFNIGGKGVLTYPSYMDYKCLTWKAVEGLAPEKIPITISLEGRLSTIPGSYGATVVPITTKPSPSGEFEEVTDGGGMVTDPNGWWELMMADNNEMRGFLVFAGQYFDHPLVTGVDTPIPVTVPPKPPRIMTAIPLADVQFVVNYCNVKFSYKLDEENWDNWQFLNEENPMGDCEDLAITHAQILLDMNYSITQMRLEWGYKKVSYAPQQYDSEGEIFKLVGHAWLVVNTDAGEKVMDNTVVTTRAAMHALYPVDGEIQTSGLWFMFVPEEGSYPIKKKAIPGFKFHADILSANSATITYA